MSRPRKKAAPAPGAAPITADELAELWAKHMPAAPQPSARAIQSLANDANAYAAQAVNSFEENEKRKAREAITMLSSWCKRDFNDNGLPHVPLYDQRLIDLATALERARPLAKPALARQWEYAAWGIWRSLRFMLEGLGAKAGFGHAAPAVKLTSAILIRVGHKSAKPNSISNELRKDTKFRERRPRLSILHRG